MLTQRAPSCAMCSDGITSPRISIRIGSFSHRDQVKWACNPTHSVWEGKAYDHPRHHAIALMCDDIDATVGELKAKGAQFRGSIDQTEYGRIIMMIVPGADDIQLYQPSHKLAYNL